MRRRGAWRNKARERKIAYNRFVKSKYLLTGTWKYLTRRNFENSYVYFQKGGLRQYQKRIKKHHAELLANFDKMTQGLKSMADAFGKAASAIGKFADSVAMAPWAPDPEQNRQTLEGEMSIQEAMGRQTLQLQQLQQSLGIPLHAMLGKPAPNPSPLPKMIIGEPWTPEMIRGMRDRRPTLFEMMYSPLDTERTQRIGEQNIQEDIVDLETGQEQIYGQVFNVMGTQTGRIDSSKPNESNVSGAHPVKITLDEIEHWKIERPIKTFAIQSMIDLKFKWSDFARIFTEFSSLDGDYITITADSTFHLGNDIEDFGMRGDVEGHDLISTHPDEAFVTVTNITYGGNGKGTWESERLIPLLSCSTGTILYQVKYKDGDTVQYRFIDGDLKVLPRDAID